MDNPECEDFVISYNGLMSFADEFFHCKQALRRGAFALATVATLFGANAAQAADFTPHECKLIYGTSLEVFNSLGKDTLSKEFRNSLVRFLVPDGKNLTCTGPTDIATPTGKDIDAYNTISSFLPFDIRTRGVRAVPSPTQ